MELLERGAVLDALAEHLAEVARGSGRLVLLRGEAGIGKTAVIAAFARESADTACVLVGRCDPLSTPRPLGPLADVAGDLGPEVEVALRDGAGSAGVFRSVLGELRSSARPIVLVFEDVHWADGATLDFIRYLARRIDIARVLMLVTYRDDEVGPTHPLTVVLGDLAGCAAVHRHDLEPLSKVGVGRLAAGGRHDPEVLYQATGGNPFFVTEVLSAGASGVPATVREAVLGRLARLPAAVKQVVEAVAVIGSPAPLDLLAQVISQPDGPVETALSAGMLQQEGRSPAFRHELARMVVLATIPEFRRVRLHADVLAALRSGPVGADELPQLAFHAEEAGDRGAVLDYAPRAARHASSLGAHREAAAQYARALRHAATSPAARRAELLEGRAFSCYMTGLIPEAVDAWGQARELRHQIGDRLREGDALRWTSYMLWLLSRNREARECGLRAVRLLREGEPSLELARAYVNVAEQASFDCDLAATEANARRALEVGRRIGDAGVVVRAQFHAAIAQVLCHDRGWDELERVWCAAREQNLVEHAGMFGPVISAVAMVHRDFERAQVYDDRAVAHCRDFDLDMFLDYLRGARSFGRVHRGQWDQAAEEAAAVLRLRSLPPVSRIFPLLALALVRARRGDPEVWPLLDEAAGLGEPSDLVRMGPVWEVRAEAAWLCGDDVAAVAESRRGLAAVTADSDPWAVGGVARWVRLAGDVVPGARATGPFALELAGEWLAAAESWDALGCHYDAALARLAGDADAVVGAVATFESLGARPAAARGRARLRELGVRYGTRGPRPATRADRHGLTSREREVLDLLRQGLSGAEIATRLFISPKTTSHHIAAILAKLGVHSQAEAIRKFER